MLPLLKEEYLKLDYIACTVENERLKSKNGDVSMITEDQILLSIASV